MYLSVFGYRTPALLVPVVPAKTRLESSITKSHLMSELFRRPGEGKERKERTREFNAACCVQHFDASDCACYHQCEHLFGRVWSGVHGHDCVLGMGGPHLSQPVDALTGQTE